MEGLMSRYGIPLKYVYRIPSDDEYILTLSPLEMVVFKETFWARFGLSLHPFLERLLVRYGLVPE